MPGTVRAGIIVPANIFLTAGPQWPGRLERLFGNTPYLFTCIFQFQLHARPHFMQLGYAVRSN